MLQLAIFNTASGLMLADWSERARDVTWTTNAHGDATLTATIPLNPIEAFAWFNLTDLLHMEVNADAEYLWRGRLEDVRLRPDGIAIAALGQWTALGDLPVTDVWSDARTNRWRPLIVDDVPGEAVSDAFQFSQSSRLYIAPRKGELHGQGQVGYLGYEPMTGVTRAAVALDFDYELTAPITWTATADSRDNTWTLDTNIWTLAGNGGTQSGTQTLTFSAADRLSFGLFYDDATPANYTGETGDIYLTITNVHVRTITSIVTAAPIAAAFADAVNSLNPTQLSDASVYIEDPGLDLYEEIYTDADMRAILTRLAALGDTQGQQWEVGVNHIGYLYLRPRGSAGRTWYTDASDIDVERSLGSVWNSVYSRYGDEITATVADTSSIARYGLTRRRAIRSRTTDTTQAQTERDTSLLDTADPLPRASVPVDRVLTPSGAVAPKWLVRSGDTMIVRNLPPETNSVIDRIRMFRIHETSYSAGTDSLEVTPESPPPLLEVLLARAMEAA